jgi:diguanylate cyclase (GGDEF)-like protein
VVDDEPAILALLVGQLGAEFEVHTACTADQAKRAVADRPIDIVLTDLMLSDATGIQLLDWVHRHAPRTARVLLTGTARIEDAADAINCCRIHRLVLKPWRAEDLLTTLRSVARSLLLERSHEHLLDEYRRLNLELERRVTVRTRELEAALAQLQVKNQILEKMALTDPLTGLPNRRAIELIARKELLRRTRLPAPIAFGLVDADRFKAINSQYLLCGGDHVLTWLGHTLQATVRATDAVGRVGGEEFMVVAPQTDRDGADILAERVRAAVDHGETAYHDARIKLTVSVGFAVAPAGSVVTYEQLREVAAGALSDAKNAGRNRCVTRTLGQ